MRSLDQVLDLLNKYHQRATYGAVAEVTGGTPRSLMSRLAREQRYSWVVNQKSGKPTGYLPQQIHPALTERKKVLSSGRQLEEWLNAPR